jgi:hypothetical protein
LVGYAGVDLVPLHGHAAAEGGSLWPTLGMLALLLLGLGALAGGLWTYVRWRFAAIPGPIA